MDQFPPNSQKAKTATREPKRVERVTSVEAVRRRRPLGKQFAHTFFGGDAHTAFHYMIANVLVPAAKEAIVEAASSGFEKLVYGDTRPRRGGAPPSAYGHIAYNRMGTQRQQDDRPPMPRGLSRGGRARHDFGELIIQHRQEAEEVLERMYDILSRYETVTVADLYELVGVNVSHTDHKWGWTELRGAQVGRSRGGGYLLDLPEPEPLGR